AAAKCRLEAGCWFALRRLGDQPALRAGHRAALRGSHQLLVDSGDERAELSASGGPTRKSAASIPTAVASTRRRRAKAECWRWSARCFCLRTTLSPPVLAHSMRFTTSACHST